MDSKSADECSAPVRSGGADLDHWIDGDRQTLCGTHRAAYQPDCAAHVLRNTSCRRVVRPGLLSVGISVYMSATMYALGVCYFWPTMYGITAERFPAGGAFLLSLMGGMGMLSDALVIPMMGRMYDSLGALPTLRYVAILPCAALLIFMLIWLYDLRHGGYRIIPIDNFVA